MKWLLLNICFIISISLHGQPTNYDTLAVQQLLEHSKKLQWVNPYQSLDRADEALALSRNINYKKGIAEALNLQGFCFWSLGDNDLAIQAAMSAMEIAQNENYPVLLAESYYIRARAYMDVGENEKARETIRSAEVLTEKSQNWELLSSIYNLKGVILFIERKIDSAHYYYTAAFEIGKRHAIDSINFPRIISNLGECYSVENPNLAFSYFGQALALARQTGNQIAEASITDIIGQAHLQKNDLKKAEDHLNASLQLAQKLGLRRVIRHAYAGLVDIKLKQGRGEEAVVYLRNYYAVRDSLLNTSKIRQIVELENAQQLQLKEQNIRLLESEAKIQTIWKNFLIVLVLAVVIISIGLYQLQKYRYRKNREMLDLEIDYLTQQHKETTERYQALVVTENEETSLESYDQKLLRKAISLVESSIGDPQLGVEKMAAELNMSRTSLHRKIKSITGFPPSEFIRSIRMRKAARLILNKVDTVTQIALSVGYDDYSHFSKAFKKHFGVSPSGYEDHHKTQQQLKQETINA